MYNRGRGMGVRRDERAAANQRRMEQSIFAMKEKGMTLDQESRVQRQNYDRTLRRYNIHVQKNEQHLARLAITEATHALELCNTYATLATNMRVMAAKIDLELKTTGITQHLLDATAAMDGIVRQHAPDDLSKRMGEFMTKLDQITDIAGQTKDVIATVTDKIVPQETVDAAMMQHASNALDAGMGVGSGFGAGMDLAGALPSAPSGAPGSRRETEDEEEEEMAALQRRLAQLKA